MIRAFTFALPKELNQLHDIHLLFFVAPCVIMGITWGSVAETFKSLLMVAENATSSDNIRFSRNSSHLCFTNLLCILDIMHSICHTSLSWVKLSSNSSMAENMFCRNNFAALGRSLISIILSWFVEIISDACLISSSKARRYVPDRFRMTMMSRI